MTSKILIVDDSQSAREAAAAALKPLPDVEVFTASNGFEALKVLPLHQFAVIIADVNLPDLNGLELIRFVKTNPHYKNTPLIVATSERRAADRDRGLAQGATDFLIKPVEPKALAELVGRYLR